MQLIAAKNTRNTTISSAQRLFSGDDGIVMVLGAMLILSLVGAVALGINAAYSLSIRGELQAAADAAALAGAARLCSQKSCWDHANETAREILRQHTVHSSLGADLSLELPAEKDTSFWDLTEERNLTVRIERGRWMPAASASQTGNFESMEGDWQANHPGVPNFIAANAVRVQIERPRTRIIPNPFSGSTQYSIGGSAIGLTAPVEPTEIAPFAIPVCALVNEEGEFQAEKICAGDRIFTRTDRYCSGDANCDTLPSRPYAICSETFKSSETDYEPNVINQSSDIASVEGWEYSWMAFYPTTPWTDQDQTDPQPLILFNEPYYESLIAANPPNLNLPGYYCYANHGLSSDGSCAIYKMNGQQAYSNVADHYGVVGLPGEGAAVSQAAFEEQIRSALIRGALTANIGETFQVLNEGLTQQNVGDDVWKKITGRFGLANEDAHPAYGESFLGTLDRTINSWQTFMGPLLCIEPIKPQRGICNSRRGEYVESDLIARFNSSHHFKLYDDVNDNTPVWKVNIPVIASFEAKAAACQGLGANIEAQLDPKHEHKIIGFVKAVLYDVDVGDSSPDWGYDDGGIGFQENCNNVRARISCDSQFVPSSLDRSPERPRLVQ